MLLGSLSLMMTVMIQLAHLKVFNKKDYLKINYFKNMHRFLPALFKMHKGRIFNVLVDDRQRFAGVSKFNFNNRFWIGIADLFRVWLLINKREKMSEEQIWLIVGFIGQTIFASRFLIQWVVSERASKSIIPNIFWWISLAGSMVLLSYAIHKVDPVFIVGQSCGLIYSRNIYLIKKEGKNKKNDPSKIMKKLVKINYKTIHESLISKSSNYSELKNKSMKME